MLSFYFCKYLCEYILGWRTLRLWHASFFKLRFKIEIYLSRTSQKKNITSHGCYTHTLSRIPAGWGWKWPLRGIFSKSPAPAQAARAGCSGHFLVFWYVSCLYRMHTCAPSICDIQFLLESSSSAVMDPFLKPIDRFLGEKYSFRMLSLQLILI